MVALAILRIEKLKSYGNVGGSEKHTARLQDTPNADPTKENIRLIGDERSLDDVVKSKIAESTKHPPRKDSVLCCEMFLSASPEYFRPDDPSKAGEWDEQRMWDFANISRQWLQEQYGELCVRAELHLDEATPHIHAYIVPVNEKTLRLSYKEMFGGSPGQGRIKLSKLQDSYARALAPLGIARGIKGSQATHTKVREYYQAVNSEPLTLELERLAPMPGETAQQLYERILADPMIQAINHQLADRKFTLQKSLRATQNALFSQKSRIESEQRATQLTRENLLWQQQLEQLHDISLDDVAWELGLNPDHKDNNRFVGGNHIININDGKFYDSHPSQLHGGGGSLDLVMHVNQCDLNTAYAWLNERYGSSLLERASIHWAKELANEIALTQEVPEFSPPTKDSSQWQAVHDYLTQKRKLPANLMQALHEQGLVYADSQQNAVFVMRALTGTFEVNGALKRGTRGEDNTFMGYEKGTKRREGWFWFRMGGKATQEIEKVVLCNSPIDAMSLAVIEVPSTRTMYLTIDSPRSLPVDFFENVPSVELAYDNSDAGNETAQLIQEILPHATRKKPLAPDWNEQLQQRKKEGKRERGKGEWELHN